MASGFTSVRERVNWRKCIFIVQVAEESIAGGLKIAGFAGKKFKYSNCEEIGGFSDK